MPDSIRATLSRSCVAFLIVLGSLDAAFTQEAEDRDSFRQLYQELRTLMDQDLDEATAFLEARIGEDPESIDRNVLRQSLASRLLDSRRQRDAAEQLAKLLNFQISRIDAAENQVGVWMTLRDLRETASGKAYSDAIDRSFDAIEAISSEAPAETLFPLSQIAAMKAQALADRGNEEEARSLVTEHVQQLIESNRGDDANEDTTQSLISMLRTLTTSEPHNDLWRDECVDYLDKCVTVAIEKYPSSIPFQNAYADTQLKMITRWRQDDPDATEKRIELVSKKLNPLASRNRSLLAILRRIEAYEQRMEAAKPPQTLVGKPVPNWEIDAWVDGSDRTQESYRGKVVLIDFWAMWCGPCIATFPHLRQWREEFGEQGFEIVGVTQYYNFVWDQSTNRASRAEDPVDASDEIETLAQFLEHHQLSHGVFVTPEQSAMSSDFGVRGIPHVVLVDRDGIVQLVKTGAGKQTADEIHAKIKELVEAPAKVLP